ncbi:hypothetical protein EGW08_013982, partial [Elysia chlorotica]
FQFQFQLRALYIIIKVIVKGLYTPFPQPAAIAITYIKILTVFFSLTFCKHDELTEFLLFGEDFFFRQPRMSQKGGHQLTANPFQNFQMTNFANATGPQIPHGYMVNSGNPQYQFQENLTNGGTPQIYEGHMTNTGNHQAYHGSLAYATNSESEYGHLTNASIYPPFHSNHTQEGPTEVFSGNITNSSNPQAVFENVTNTGGAQVLQENLTNVEYYPMYNQRLVNSGNHQSQQQLLFKDLSGTNVLQEISGNVGNFQAFNGFGQSPAPRRNDANAQQPQISKGELQASCRNVNSFSKQAVHFEDLSDAEHSEKPSPKVISSRSVNNKDGDSHQISNDGSQANTYPAPKSSTYQETSTCNESSPERRIYNEARGSDFYSKREYDEHLGSPQGSHLHKDRETNHSASYRYGYRSRYRYPFISARSLFPPESEYGDNIEERFSFLPDRCHHPAVSSPNSVRRTRISPRTPSSPLAGRGYRPLQGSGASVDFSPISPGRNCDNLALVRHRPAPSPSWEELDDRCRLLGYSHTAFFCEFMNRNEELADINSGMMATLQQGSELLKEGFKEYRKMGTEIKEKLDENRTTMKEMQSELKDIRQLVEDSSRMKSNHDVHSTNRPVTQRTNVIDRDETLSKYGNPYRQDNFEEFNRAAADGANRNIMSIPQAKFRILNQPQAQSSHNAYDGPLPSEVSHQKMNRPVSAGTNEQFPQSVLVHAALLKGDIVSPTANQPKQNDKEGSTEITELKPHAIIEDSGCFPIERAFPVIMKPLQEERSVQPRWKETSAQTVTHHTDIDIASTPNTRCKTSSASMQTNISKPDSVATQTETPATEPTLVKKESGMVSPVESKLSSLTLIQDNNEASPQDPAPPTHQIFPQRLEMTLRVVLPSRGRGKGKIKLRAKGNTKKLAKPKNVSGSVAVGNAHSGSDKGQYFDAPHDQGITQETKVEKIHRAQSNVLTQLDENKHTSYDIAYNPCNQARAEETNKENIPKAQSNMMTQLDENKHTSYDTAYKLYNQARAEETNKENISKALSKESAYSNNTEATRQDSRAGNTATEADNKDREENEEAKPKNMSGSDAVGNTQSGQDKGQCMDATNDQGRTQDTKVENTHRALSSQLTEIDENQPTSNDTVDNTYNQARREESNKENIPKAQSKESAHSDNTEATSQDSRAGITAAQRHNKDNVESEKAKPKNMSGSVAVGNAQSGQDKGQCMDAPNDQGRTPDTKVEKSHRAQSNMMTQLDENKHTSYDTAYKLYNQARAEETNKENIPKAQSKESAYSNNTEATRQEYRAGNTATEADNKDREENEEAKPKNMSGSVAVGNAQSGQDKGQCMDATNDQGRTQDTKVEKTHRALSSQLTEMDENLLTSYDTVDNTYNQARREETNKENMSGPVAVVNAHSGPDKGQYFDATNDQGRTQDTKVEKTHRALSSQLTEIDENQPTSYDTVDNTYNQARREETNKENIPKAQSKESAHSDNTEATSQDSRAGITAAQRHNKDKVESEEAKPKNMSGSVAVGNAHSGPDKGQYFDAPHDQGIKQETKVEKTHRAQSNMMTQLDENKHTSYDTAYNPYNQARAEETNKENIPKAQSKESAHSDNKEATRQDSRAGIRAAEGHNKDNVESEKAKPKNVSGSVAVGNAQSGQDKGQCMDVPNDLGRTQDTKVENTHRAQSNELARLDENKPTSYNRADDETTEGNADTPSVTHRALSSQLTEIDENQLTSYNRADDETTEGSADTPYVTHRALSSQLTEIDENQLTSYNRADDETTEGSADTPYVTHRALSSQLTEIDENQLTSYNKADDETTEGSADTPSVTHRALSSQLTEIDEYQLTSYDTVYNLYNHASLEEINKEIISKALSKESAFSYNTEATRQDYRAGNTATEADNKDREENEEAKPKNMSGSVAVGNTQSGQDKGQCMDATNDQGRTQDTKVEKTHRALSSQLTEIDENQPTSYDTVDNTYNQARREETNKENIPKAQSKESAHSDNTEATRQDYRAGNTATEADNKDREENEEAKPKNMSGSVAVGNTQSGQDKGQCMDATNDQGRTQEAEVEKTHRALSSRLTEIDANQSRSHNNADVQTAEESADKNSNQGDQSATLAPGEDAGGPAVTSIYKEDKKDNVPEDMTDSPNMNNEPSKNNQITCSEKPCDTSRRGDPHLVSTPTDWSNESACNDKTEATREDSTAGKPTTEGDNNDKAGTKGTTPENVLRSFIEGNSQSEMDKDTYPDSLPDLEETEDTYIKTTSETHLNQPLQSDDIETTHQDTEAGESTNIYVYCHIFLVLVMFFMLFFPVYESFITFSSASTGAGGRI